MILSLCFFALAWVKLGREVTLRIFAAVCLCCAVDILLLYWYEEFFSDRAEIKDQIVTPASNDRLS